MDVRSVGGRRPEKAGSVKARKTTRRRLQDNYILCSHGIPYDAYRKTHQEKHRRRQERMEDMYPKQ